MKKLSRHWIWFFVTRKNYGFGGGPLNSSDIIKKDGTNNNNEYSEKMSSNKSLLEEQLDQILSKYQDFCEMGQFENRFKSCKYGGYDRRLIVLWAGVGKSGPEAKKQKIPTNKIYNCK